MSQLELGQYGKVMTSRRACFGKPLNFTTGYPTLVRKNGDGLCGGLLAGAFRQAEAVGKNVLVLHDDDPTEDDVGLCWNILVFIRRMDCSET